MSFTPNTLHITNGDMAVKVLKDAGIEGDLLAWRDVLHEGPVPFGMSLEELSEVRINFLASRGWKEKNEIKEWFQHRDNKLIHFRDYDQLVLWFEHDLYDQLQLLQVLAYLAGRDLHKYPLYMSCSDHYLGMLSSEGVKSLINDIQPVSYEQINVATTAWQVFTLNTPEEWYNLLAFDTSCLPYLAGAIQRLLEEYPNINTGLTATQFKALQIINQSGPVPLTQVFSSYQQSEERRFMGDIVFWSHMSSLFEGEEALLSLPEGETLSFSNNKEQLISLTEQGKKVLAGEMRWPGIAEIDRWIGGVHLTSKECWFWDDKGQRLVHHKLH